MPRCPDDGQELVAKSASPTCPRCGGVWAAGDELAALVPKAGTHLLAPETRADSAVFKKPRNCPDCAAMLAPWRIGQLDARADRCPSCERFWLEKQDLRSLEMVAKRQAVQQAYQSFTAKEREEIARDLAQASEGEGYPLSPIHATLASLGLPVIRRTQGSRTPIVTWLLALGLVIAYVVGGATQVADWGLHPANATLTDAFTANFAHFGVLHLVGNLYFLLAFGDGVEQRLWRPLVLVMFAVFGTAALMLDGLAQPEVEVIAGASGGIAAIMGACVVLQPQAQVVMAVAERAVKVPIWGWGLAELGLQALLAILGVPGTAWIAHLAGMILGGVACTLLRAAKLEIKPQPA